MNKIETNPAATPIKARPTNPTMKALVKARKARGLDLLQRPVPEIGRNDVLVKIRKTAICGTDVHIWQWDDWARKTVPVPLITGHEFAGEIVEIGDDVEGLAIGQRVTGEGHLVGNRSRASRSGRFHLDPDTRGVGVNEPGAFAEYLRLPAFNIVPLPDSISDEIGALLDPLGNAVHAALTGDLIGEDVLITGAGPIGIMAAAVCRHAGARNVVLTDINDKRLALAEQVADIVTVNVCTEDLNDVEHRLGIKDGFAVGLEMSGSEQAFTQMVDALAPGGRIAMMGIPARPTTVDWSKVVFKALIVQGIYGRQMFDTWYKMIAMLQSGLDISAIITHRYPVWEYHQGFSEMIAGNSGKVVLDWD